jgi:cytochrome oxidase assembly protein ShyY1
MSNLPESNTPESNTVEKSSFVVAVILIILIGLALWQFYSLAWGEVIRSSYAIDVNGAISLAASL